MPPDMFENIKKDTEKREWHSARLLDSGGVKWTLNVLQDIPVLHHVLASGPDFLSVLCNVNGEL